MTQKKWIFRAEMPDDEIYLDSNGNEIDYLYAVPFIGNVEDAKDEADRRAILFESKNKGIIARITYESLGKIADDKENG